jgi:hypothetical protein
VSPYLSPVDYDLSDESTSRFWSRVDRRGPDECWPWTVGGRGVAGRASFYVGGRNVPAPRYALLASGVFPQTRPRHACHKCDNPPCCNPAHLWWGTNAENMRDAAQKKRLVNTRKTHCPKGHPLSGKNVRIIRGTQRRCGQCTVDRQRARRAEQRAALSKVVQP